MRADRLERNATAEDGGDNCSQHPKRARRRYATIHSQRYRKFQYQRYVVGERRRGRKFDHGHDQRDGNVSGAGNTTELELGFDRGDQCGGYDGASEHDGDASESGARALALNPSSVTVGAFSITITGSDFVQGAQVMFGTAPLTTTFNSASQLTATGTATASEVGSVTVTVQNPDPGSVTSTNSEAETVTANPSVSYDAAVRFLEQSTFGPTPQLISQVEQSGFSAFLTSQFSASGSTYPDPASTVTSITPTQQVFFTNALNNSDQLRQRVALALSEIWVTSNLTVPPQGMAPCMRRPAAGCVRQLPHADERRNAESGDGAIPQHGEQ